MAGRDGAGGRQRGWAGIIAMLLALCLVALLAGTIVRQYGLGGGTAPRAGADAATSEAAGGIAPAAPVGTTPPPQGAIGLARGVEDTVRQQAADLDQRIDAGTK
jgi:hypothetical protein